jgi:hypothetical protein
MERKAKQRSGGTNETQKLKLTKIPNNVLTSFLMKTLAPLLTSKITMSIVLYSAA